MTMLANPKRIASEFNIITSWDDFCPQNMRLANMLLQYNLPAIFFIDVAKEGSALQVKELFDLGFTIGNHTVSHPMDMKELSHSMMRYEILSAKIRIERITSEPCNLFAYPRGRYNEDVIKIVKDTGHSYARTTQIKSTDINEKIFEAAAHVHVYNRKEYNGIDWYDYAIQAWDNCVDSVFHIWGHGWEIEKYQDWDKLEQFFKYITTK